MSPLSTPTNPAQPTQPKTNKQTNKQTNKHLVPRWKNPSFDRDSKTSLTSLAISKVRTKGIIISTFFKPISPRTIFTAWHSQTAAGFFLGGFPGKRNGNLGGNIAWIIKMNNFVLETIFFLGWHVGLRFVYTWLVGVSISGTDLYVPSGRKISSKIPTKIMSPVYVHLYQGYNM